MVDIPILLKRSNVAGATPLTLDLSLGELALNTNDARLFCKNSANEIREFGIFERQLFQVVDRKNQGTNGGTFTSDAWRTRDLNTIRTNEIFGASLSANQIILPAGEYHCQWSAPAFDNVNVRHATRLYDITGAATLILGGSTESDDTVNLSVGSGRFTLSAQSNVELQHRRNNNQNTDGFGRAAGFDSEIYSQISIWKIK